MDHYTGVLQDPRCNLTTKKHGMIVAGGWRPNLSPEPVQFLPQQPQPQQQQSHALLQCATFPAPFPDPSPEIPMSIDNGVKRNKSRKNFKKKKDTKSLAQKLEEQQNKKANEDDQYEDIEDDGKKKYQPFHLRTKHADITMGDGEDDEECGSMMTDRKKHSALNFSSKAGIKKKGKTRATLTKKKRQNKKIEKALANMDKMEVRNIKQRRKGVQPKPEKRRLNGLKGV